MNKLKKLLQLIDSASLKNQWLLISLGIVSIACCLFSPTVWSVLIAVVISVRIFFTKNKSCYLVFLAFISVMVVRSYFMEQAALTVEQSTITQLVIYPSQAKVNGNQYTGIAYTQQNQAVAFSAVISSEEEKEKLEQLEEPILVTGTFEMIKPEAARNQYGFNYQQFLWSKSIRVQVFIKQIASITKHTSFFSFIEEWKMKLYHYIQHIPYSLVSSYSLALLLGDKSQIDGEALRDFKQLGILHLLVISGLHITIMSQLVLKLLWRIGCPREWSFCIVSVLLVVYGELVNWGVSSTRAILMMVFALMCRLFVWKQVSSMDRFAIVMLMAVIVQPTIFLSSSFVLSYGMSGCVLVTGYLFRLWDKNWQTQLSKIIYMSLCSVMLLAPLFFEVNIIAGVLTVICSWGLAVVLLPLLVVNLVGFGIIGELTELLLTMLEQGIHWLNTIQPFRVIIGHGTFYWWGLYGVLLLFLGLFIEQKHSFVKQCTCICSLLFILVMIPYRFEE